MELEGARSLGTFRAVFSRLSEGVTAGGAGSKGVLGGVSGRGQSSGRGVGYQAPQSIVSSTVRSRTASSESSMGSSSIRTLLYVWDQDYATGIDTVNIRVNRGS